MPAVKALPQFEAFGAYANPFGASQTALSFWTDYWRRAAETAIWWSERWLQTATAMTPWSAATAMSAWSAAPVGSAAAAPDHRPVAAIIDLAQAAAARSAAEVGDVASEVVEIAETVAEIPMAVAGETVVAVEEAAREVAPVDDLTRLVGIGPKLAMALAERGVTRFAQIAAWTEEDLAGIDKALDLKGRAVRDAWVAQAKRMCSEG